jgi:hypothetical protein
MGFNFADQCFAFCKTAQTQEALKKLFERNGVAGNYYDVADVLNVVTAPSA